MTLYITGEAEGIPPHRPVAIAGCFNERSRRQRRGFKTPGFFSLQVAENGAAYKLKPFDFIENIKLKW